MYVDETEYIVGGIQEIIFLKSGGSSINHAISHN